MASVLPLLLACLPFLHLLQVLQIDDGGITYEEEGVRRQGGSIGDVEDDDGVRGRARGTCGLCGGILDGPTSSLTRSVQALYPLSAIEGVQAVAPPPSWNVRWPALLPNVIVDPNHLCRGREKPVTTGGATASTVALFRQNKGGCRSPLQHAARKRKTLRRR
nr:hypothetical protein Iba_chr12bCG17500 [Ipomoea batatas]